VVGSSILSGLLDWLTGNGVISVEITVAKLGVATQQLATKFGFKQESEFRLTSSLTQGFLAIDLRSSSLELGN
jgi:hypothetical protein